MELRDTMRECRIRKNITQEKLSEMTGVMQSNINRIETGQQHPQKKTRQLIEKVLGKINWSMTQEIGRVRHNHPGIIIEQGDEVAFTRDLTYKQRG